MKTRLVIAKYHDGDQVTEIPIGKIKKRFQALYTRGLGL